jgi:hypothetical protein
MGMKVAEAESIANENAKRLRAMALAHDTFVYKFLNAPVIIFVCGSSSLMVAWANPFNTKLIGYLMTVGWIPDPFFFGGLLYKYETGIRIR